jgi:hypothetical protein
MEGKIISKRTIDYKGQQIHGRTKEEHQSVQAAKENMQTALFSVCTSPA